MKKLILSITAFVFASALFAQKTIADVAKFETETINQGNLKQNDPKEVKFVVVNISKEPLVIEQANPTCGCTIGDFTKTPIAPGEKGYISAKYNAAAVGHFDKHMTVKFAGVDEVKSITLSGDVLAAEEYDKWVAEEAKKKNEAITTKKPAVVKEKKPTALSKAKPAKTKK